MKFGLIAAAIAVCATTASAQSQDIEGEIEGATGGEIDASFAVIDVDNGTTGEHAVTIRQVEGGTNVYSRHEVSCDPYLIGLAGTAPTLDLLNSSLISNPPLTEIIRASTEDAIAEHVCLL